MRAWEPEEDRLIIEMLSQHGPRWAQIVKRLPGRTISSVRNRWQRIERGRRMGSTGSETKNRCQWCGQPKRGHVCFARMAPRAPSRSDDADDSRGRGGSPEESPASTPRPARPASDDAALVNELPSASDLEDGDGDSESEEAREPPSVPIICRVKSGARICGELGFESTVNAAGDVADIEQPAVVPISKHSVSERSEPPEVLSPSRLPSLRQLAPTLVA